MQILHQKENVNQEWTLSWWLYAEVFGGRVLVSAIHFEMDFLKTHWWIAGLTDEQICDKYITYLCWKNFKTNGGQSWSPTLWYCYELYVVRLPRVWRGTISENKYAERTRNKEWRGFAGSEASLAPAQAQLQPCCLINNLSQKIICSPEVVQGGFLSLTNQGVLTNTLA